MCRGLTAYSEVPDNRHKRRSEMPEPDVIDRHARCQWILLACQPTSESETASRAGGRIYLPHRCVGVSGMSQSVERGLDFLLSCCPPFVSVLSLLAAHCFERQLSAHKL